MLTNETIKQLKSYASIDNTEESIEDIYGDDSDAEEFDDVYDRCGGNFDDAYNCGARDERILFSSLAKKILDELKIPL